METPNDKYSGKEAPILLTSLLIISACAIFYELLISTISTYLLGSSVLHFSVTIGLFLSSMGLGAYISKFIEKELLKKFILIELMLGLLGGLSAIILYSSNAFTGQYYVVLIGLIVVLGTLIGMEIPLLTRLLKSYEDIKDVIAKVLAFDYLGALVASLLFPLLLLPLLGVMRTAFFVGFINVLIAVFNLIVFRDKLRHSSSMKWFSASIVAVLVAGMAYSYQLVGFFDQMQYNDKVIFTEQTKYQKIVLSQWNNDLRLFLNGNLQFSSVDEYRYHEPLVHIPAMLTFQPEEVLVLGGGDGLAVKELLKYENIGHIDLVDIDDRMLDLAKENPLFLELNQGALLDPKVCLHAQDAFTYVKYANKLYDLVIIDLPDPSDHAVSKMYSKEFYQMLWHMMTEQGVMVTQSTSPFFARKPFWCINHTLEDVFAHVLPYKAYVPSFGLWGFNMVSKSPLCLTEKDNSNCLVERIESKLAASDIEFRFLNADNIDGLFHFDKDVEEVETPINQLDQHHLVELYEKSWQTFNN